MDNNVNEIYRKNTRMVNKVLNEVNCGIILYNFAEESITYSNAQAISFLEVKKESDINFERFLEYIPTNSNGISYFSFQLESGKLLDCSYKQYEQDGVKYGLISINSSNDQAVSKKKVEVSSSIQIEENEKDSIISVLAADYLEIYHFNVNDGLLIPLKTTNKEEYTYKSFVAEILNKCQSDNLAEIKTKLSIDQVLTAISYDGTFEISLKINNSKEEADYIKLVFTPYLTKDELLLGVKDISDIVKKELRQQESLKLALEEANLANNAKTTFLSNMSHDIRTPLNAIIGFTNLAIEKADDKEKLEDYLSKISTSGDHLLNLINDILDMSRIESGKLHIEEEKADIISIVKEVEDMMNSSANAKNISMNFDIHNVKNSKILCDKLRIKQVFSNLLSNAVKFTPNGGSISFIVEEMKYSMPKTVSYTFTVKDTGIGMSKKFLEKLFVPFERARTSTISGIQGTGLGMSICKSIVDLMGGEISVESEPGKGTTFTVSLGFKTWDEEKIEISSTETNSTDIKNVKILLVEDNELNREIAVDFLEGRGAKVTCAVNGLEALNIMKSNGKFDVILMDIQMPIMDGYEATREIRKLDNGAIIPIIAMTANAFAEDRKNAINAGMNEHITKPIDIDIVSQTIHRLIKEGK